MNMQFEKWSATGALAPEFFKEGDILGMCSGGRPYCTGKWVSTVKVQPGTTYETKVEYLAENASDTVYFFRAMVNWRDADGNYIQREYLSPAEAAPDGYTHMYNKACAPAKAAQAEIELALLAPGTVRWRNASMEETAPVTPRPVRIASAFFEPRRNLDKNLEVMLALTDKAGQQKADVLLFTESCYDRGVMPIEKKCVPMDTVNPGPVKQFAEKAKQYNCNIMLNLTEGEDGFFFNTTVLIDRAGQVVGKYRKSHLPTAEIEIGYSPGNELPVFDMDFGKVGVLTCFDMNFVQNGQRLRSQGAEIIFVPTIGSFMMCSLMQAHQHGLYVVMSGGDAPLPSRVVAPNGEVLGSVDGSCDDIAFADIDLAQPCYNMGTGFYPAIADSRHALFHQQRPELYSS